MIFFMNIISCIGWLENFTKKIRNISLRRTLTGYYGKAPMIMPVRTPFTIFHGNLKTVMK